MFKLLGFGGNPNIGVYAHATERVAILSPSLTERERADVAEALEVDLVQTRIGGANIVGSLVSANETGVVVPDYVMKDELKVLERTGLRVLVLDDRLNAAGNNILATDAGALVNPDYPDKTVRLIEKTLGVPVQRGTLANLGTVGMAGVATRRGVLVHPKSTPEEREVARRLFGYEVMVGTINHGTGLIGAGLIANSKGACVGVASTGIEIARIEDALGFLPPANTPSTGA